MTAAADDEMLLEGRVSARGLVIPEQLDPDEYLARPRAKGLAIHEQRTVL
ncbi:MAG TPA: hypothetical protein VEY12_08295 [Thermoplasmata archaeon]|nr:hypothetical protein [Thermoplasmata archaeon]